MRKPQTIPHAWKTLCLLAATSLAVAGMVSPAEAREPKVIYQGPALQLGATRYILHSEKIGRDFQIDVTSPIRPVAPGEKLAAIYALDGGFGLVGQALVPLAAESEVAPAFVISVGYTNPLTPISGVERNIDFAYNRSVSARDGKTYGGGGADFEDFLLNEVRPFIEARYPVDPGRAILAGHSGGGIFAAGLLARKPDAFLGWMMGGTPMQMDAGLGERIKAAAPKGAGRKVFVFYTPNDVRSGGRPAELAAALTAPGSTFVVREKVYEGRTHNGSYLMWMSDALPFLLPGEERRPQVWPKPVSLPDKALDRYVGVYETVPGATIAVLKHQGRLYGRIGEGTPFELFAASPTKFVAHTQPMDIDFTRGVTMKLRGVEQAARKTRAVPATPAVFPDPERPVTTVSPAVLQSYVGTYKAADGRVLALQFDSGQFYVALGGARAALYPYSDTEFFAVTTNATIWFEPGAAGKTLSFRANNGQAFKAERQP